MIVNSWSRFLTRIANVAFQPPCICVFGSNPRSSGPCNAECHTLDTVPPGIPSYVFPTGVFETVSNHWASSVAEADWRGTRRCRVLKERRSNQDSSEPIMLPTKVRSRWSCYHLIRTVKGFRNTTKCSLDSKYPEFWLLEYQPVNRSVLRNISCLHF